MQKREIVKQALAKRRYEAPVMVGKGAFAEVYRVRDCDTGQFKACKVSCDSNMARRETAFLQEISHPVFPKYQENWQEDAFHFLIMEYIPGCNLRKMVERRGKLHQRQAVEISMELAAGLDFLHRRPQPIVFRDVKPENILIRADGRVKLIDMGCAYRTDSGEKTLAGSRGYGAPEQFMQDGVVTPASDVYALGKLLYYMLTGVDAAKTLLYGESVRAYDKHISPGLEQLIALATREEPSMRIPDMYTMLQQLSCYGGEGYCNFRKKYGLKKRIKDAAAVLGFCPKIEFYYEKNIWKGKV